MQFKTLTLFTALVPAALADFKVFCGVGCNTIDGTGCPSTCIFLNNPASCEDVDNSVAFRIQSDVSGACGGVACDGCDISKPAGDWTITRLEIHDGTGCTPSRRYFGNAGDDPHFTIYNDNGVVNILDTNNNNLGSCTVPANPQVVTCNSGIGETALKNSFDCVSSVFYEDSAN